MTKNDDDNFVTQRHCAEIQSTQNRWMNEHTKRNFYSHWEFFSVINNNSFAWIVAETMLN
jgi:hypothetical protein